MSTELNKENLSGISPALASTVKQTRSERVVLPILAQRDGSEGTGSKIKPWGSSRTAGGDPPSVSVGWWHKMTLSIE